MYDINLIKKRINCVDYAQKIGLSIREEGDRCVSPLRTNAKNPTSFVVWADFFYDFSAGMGGDVIDFCANYSHKGDRGAAIRELASLTGVVSDNIQDSQAWLEYTKQLNSRTAYYNTQLTDSALLIARYDNLGKGASGAAVECLNIATGNNKTLSLEL